MKPAALGIRMHSGWGILVAVNHEIEIIERRRIVITEGHGPRGNQPFHHAQELSLEKAEGFLAEYRSISERLARRELEAATAAIERRINGLAAKKYSEQNLNNLATSLFHGYNVSAEVLCFSCIKTLPPQSEIKISFFSGGSAIRRIIDISYTEDNNIKFVGMHE